MPWAMMIEYWDGELRDYNVRVAVEPSLNIPLILKKMGIPQGRVRRIHIVKTFVGVKR